MNKYRNKLEQEKERQEYLKKEAEEKKQDDYYKRTSDCSTCSQRHNCYVKRVDGNQRAFDCIGYSQDREQSSGGCFLTTVCVEYYNKPDNCYELETLRKFRDTILIKSKEEELIREYYIFAPSIAARLKEKNSKEDYEYIYSMILNCIECIKKNDNQTAMNIYYEMFLRMKNKFLISGVLNK